MAANKVVLSLMVLCLSTQVQSSNHIYENLVDYIIGESNPKVIPMTSPDKPVKVSIDMSIKAVSKVDKTTNKVEIEVWPAMTWNMGVTFDPADFNGLTGVRIPVSDVWVPDLAVYNGDLSIVENFGENQVIISYDGHATWVPHTRIHVQCDLADDMIANNTTCTIKLGSWVYSSNSLTLAESNDFNFMDYFEGSKYEIIDTSSVRQVKTYSCCPESYENMMYTFSFLEKK